MKVKVDNRLNRKGLLSLSLLCGLTLSSIALVGCNKKSDPADDARISSETAETSQTEAPSVMLQCNENIAINNLKQSIKNSIRNRSQILINDYANSAGTSVNLTALNGAIDSILIDFSNAKEIQPINENGMLTCGAKVSLTVPNKDVKRAEQVFSASDGSSFSQRLQASNITLNNNMLVSDKFSYVVGMRGGQMSAKIIGQPEIISAVAQVIAASQFEVAMAEKRQSQTSNSNIDAIEPLQPQSIERVETPEPEAPKPQPQKTEPKPKSESKPERLPQPKPTQAPKKPKIDSNPNQPETISSAELNDPADFKVPSDDSIEMVIIEEEGTY